MERQSTNTWPRWALLAMLLSIAVACRTGIKSEENASLASGSMDQVTYTVQNQFQISPNGLSVLVHRGRAGYAWYSLPTGKMLKEGRQHGGVTLMGFSQEGLAWLRDKTAIMEALPDRTEREVVALKDGTGWLAMYVAAHNQASAGLIRVGDGTMLNIYAPPGDTTAAITRQVPEADQHQLMSDNEMTILAVIGQDKNATRGRLEFLRRTADSLVSLRVLDRDYASPAMGHGMVAWAEENGIKLMNSEGNVSTLAGNLQDEVRFFADGTRLLSTRVESKPDDRHVKVKARVFSVADRKLLHTTELKVEAGHQFFLDPEENLYAIRLNAAAEPVITEFPWASK